MSKISMKFAASLAAMSVVPSGMMWAEGAHADVMRLAEEKKFEAALNVLAQQNAALQNERDHKLLKARLLSWDGRYEEAAALLKELKTEHPESSDVDVVLGYLSYYQNKFDDAERHFASALAKAPGHSDAADGQKRVREAKQSAERAGRRWRIDSGIGVSTFDQETIEDWGEQFLNVSRKQNDFTFTVGANRYERFGAVDTQINAAITHSKRGNVDWGLVASTTPDADFRPKTTLGGHVGKAFQVNEEITTHVAVHYFNNAFDDKTVHSIQPEATTYFKNGVTVKAKALITAEENQDTQIGWLAEARGPISKHASARIGVADAPELINGNTVSTQSVFGGVSFEVSDGLTFHVNLARADRQDLHVRNDVSVGITRKF